MNYHLHRHADLLAALRVPGRTDEQVIEILAALACSFPPEDPVTEALDACAERISEGAETGAARDAEEADYYAKRNGI